MIMSLLRKPQLHISSGGPVMTLQGKVVGIATLKIQECENCNFAYNIKLAH